MIHPKAVRPPARIAAMLLAICSGATSCTKPAPPRLADADLVAAMFASVGLSGGAPARMPDIGKALGSCVDLHGERISLQDDTRPLSSWKKLAMRVGIVGGFDHWQMPTPSGPEPVAAATERRLARASAFAQLTADAMEAGRPKRRRSGCASEYWFDRPIYEDSLAFVDQGESCGGLCGSGSTLALEYHGNRWRLVGMRRTWIS